MYITMIHFIKIIYENEEGGSSKKLGFFANFAINGG